MKIHSFKTRRDQIWFQGVPLVLATLFLILTSVIILFPQAINFLDRAGEDIVLSWRDELLTLFFSTLTLCGETWFLATATVVVAIWFFSRNEQFFFPFLIAIGMSAFFTKITKVFVARPRPEDGLIAESSFSFPSGHASNSTAFYGFLAFFLFTKFSRKIQRVILVTTTLFFLLLMGISRMYLGVHFTSDVLGGYLMGGFWLTIALLVYRRTA